jgi:hypothetical protein
MDNWHGKHPIPWDYFNSMNSGSGKNLNWFFNNWFFTNYYDDLAIKNVTKTAGGYKINIQNIGGFVIPFNVKLIYADGTTESFHQTPAVWEKDQKQITVNIKTVKSVKTAELDNGIFMDADESNNKWTAK